MRVGRGLLRLGLCVAAVLFSSSDWAMASFVAQSATSLVLGWTYSNDQQGSQCGYAVAAGDINGDGYADVVVGSPLAYLSTDREGAVYVFFGGAGGLESSPRQVLGAGQKGARFGAALAFLGDINGDGYGDFAVGAPEYNGGELRSEAGAVFIHYGTRTGLSITPDWVTYGPQARAQFGYALAGGGDANGDGWADLLVGAPLHSNDQNNEGRAYLFLGSTTGILTTTVQTLEGDQAAARFGDAVGFVGDVNQDGFDDIAVGAPYHDRGLADVGAVYVFLGAEAELSFEPGWILYGANSGARLGSAVAGADSDADGYAELVVGAPGGRSTTAGEGAVFVYDSGSEGLNEIPVWQVYGGQSGALLGAALSVAGDINGDGLPDLAAGAPAYTSALDPQSAEGAVLIFLGNGSSFEASPRWVLEGNKADTTFGSAVAIAGRMDDDSYDDVIVGAPTYKYAEEPRGRAFAFRGASAEFRATVFLPLVMRSEPIVAAR